MEVGVHLIWNSDSSSRFELTFSDTQWGQNLSFMGDPRLNSRICLLNYPYRAPAFSFKNPHIGRQRLPIKWHLLDTRNWADSLHFENTKSATRQGIATFFKKVQCFGVRLFVYRKDGDRVSKEILENKYYKMSTNTGSSNLRNFV